MKNIKELLNGIKIKEILNQNDELMISNITFDSRNVDSNTLFIATRGTQVDGHDFIHKALEKGAIAIVCEIVPNNINHTCPIIVVENTHYTLGLIASNFYCVPSEKLTVVGITGTNGKTSTATILYDLFTLLGYKVGLLSTIQIRINDEIIHSTHTTPDAIAIQKNMSLMVEKGCSFCFMEVSSHAIDQDRISGIKFKGAVFTNITHDHLDYHLTFSNYLAAKKKFFDQLDSTSFSIINIDDRNGKVMVQNTASKVNTVAMHSLADYTVKIIDMTMSFMTLRINQEEVIMKIVGEFNAYNILSAYAVAIELGMKREDVLLNLSKIDPVEGRIDVVSSAFKNIKGVIDYAHTPDAVEKVLIEIGKINRKGKIITVIGCGGNRDKEKRPIMAQLACRYSDRVILTSDNPRNEDPKHIIEDMKRGLTAEDIKKAITVIDRKEAIKTACMLSDEFDIIALVGKGHEKYQEISGERFPFDDKEELKSQFEEQGL